MHVEERYFDLEFALHSLIGTPMLQVLYVIIWSAQENIFVVLSASTVDPEACLDL